MLEQINQYLQYIHGGGFGSGTNRGNYNKLVLQEEVMVISIAYRLGIYGFLWSPNPEDPDGHWGNWGLLDQTAAMEWAQSWATYFTGDPSQV